MCFLCDNLMAKNAIFEMWPWPAVARPAVARPAVARPAVARPAVARLRYVVVAGGFMVVWVYMTQSHVK